MPKSKNAIVLVSDSNYLEYTKQVFCSAWHYGNWKGDFVLLSCGVPDENLVWFKERGIHVMPLPPIIDKPVNGWPPVVFHKLYLLHPCMKKWHKIVYLDTDVMVFGDVNKLVNYGPFTACNENASGDVRSQFADEAKLDNHNIQLMQQLQAGYELKTPAFNVGVMVIDTMLCDKTLFEQAIGLASLYEPLLVFPEQAVFNLLFIKNWQVLPEKYSQYPYGISESEIRAEAENHLFRKYIRIRHFIGPYKPWLKENTFNKQWRKNLSLADDFNSLPQTGTNPNALTTFFSPLVLFAGHVSWLCGQFLKRYFPILYYKIKGHKNHD